MTDRTAPADGAAAALLACIDALTYALLVALVTTVGAVALGVLTGGGLLRAKYVLFVAGFLLLSYATLRLWPSSPADLETDERSGGSGTSLPAVAEESRFQRLVRAAPPMRWLGSPPPERRLSPPSKLFLGSLLVLLASYLLETAFGVA